jgi:hypothetical protein
MQRLIANQPTGAKKPPDGMVTINVLMTCKSSTTVLGGSTVRYIDTSTSKSTGTSNSLVNVPKKATLAQMQEAITSSLQASNVAVDFSDEGDHVLHVVALPPILSLKLVGQRVEHIFARCTETADNYKLPAGGADVKTFAVLVPDQPVGEGGGPGAQGAKVDIDQQMTTQALQLADAALVSVRTRLGQHSVGTGGTQSFALPL